MTPTDITELERYLTQDEREELAKLIDLDLQEVMWRPTPGPQTMAFNSKADVIGFGGSAGGGKTEVAIGKALEQHHHAIIFRREGTQLQGIEERLRQLLGSDEGYNSTKRVWRDAGPRKVLLEFGSVPNLGDEQRYQGRPHDLICFDEASNFLESQVRFLMGWNRSAIEGVHSQVLMAFNPPTNSEGRWVLAFFGPWLDKKHHLYPTPPGDIHYAAMIPSENGTSKDVWVADARPFILVGGVPEYNFDPKAHKIEDIITPQSRTFIPSRISDNPYLANSGYLRQLQAMPEPLRSQMLYGDFQAGMQDDAFQVIPTAWVEAAQARWKERSPRGEMLSMGVDVARGGKDNTTIATRHKTPETIWWFDKLKVYPGKATPDGQTTAGLVIAESRGKTPIHLDVIGVGASPYDLLKGTNQPVYGINVSEKALGTDKSGKLTFFNQRSQLWWKMRELLDPQYETGACLPPDPDLLAELCAPKWGISGMSIKVESREDIVDRVGRSPDRATAVILAAIDTPKVLELDMRQQQSQVLDYDPYR